MSRNGPPPIEISRTPPSKPSSRLNAFLKVNCAVVEEMKNDFSRRSSEIQFGSFTNAALGADWGFVVVVAQGFDPAQSVVVIAVNPEGNAGAVTPSKFSEHCAAVLGT